MRHYTATWISYIQNSTLRSRGGEPLTGNTTRTEQNLNPHETIGDILIPRQTTTEEKKQRQQIMDELHAVANYRQHSQIRKPLNLGSSDAEVMSSLKIIFGISAVGIVTITLFMCIAAAYNYKHKRTRVHKLDDNEIDEGLYNNLKPPG